MAEALARHFWNDGMEARSAGLDPLGYVPPLTLEVLNEAGVPTGRALFERPFRCTAR